MMIYFFACQIYPDKNKAQDSSIAQESASPDTDTLPDTDSSVEPDPGKTVVMLTVDTLNSDFVSLELNGNPVTPNLDALFAQSATFPNTLTTRGQTSPALASIMTGLYPRSTKVRSNPRVLEESYVTIPERFQEAGYTTLGFSSNFCHYIDSGIDIRGCTHPDEEPDLEQTASDSILVTELISAIEAQPREEDLFIWLHLIDPHDPYHLIEPHFSKFHPQEYDGILQTDMLINLNILNETTFGNQTLTQEDEDYFKAVYASQVAEVDVQLQSVMETLNIQNRLNDAILVFGSDHGEELGAHNNYYYHGCSAFNSVVGTKWSFKSPSIPPNTYDGWISTTDVAPTISGLAGLEWAGPKEGRDLSSMLENESVTHEPVFVERGTETAGVIFQQYKYILSTLDQFENCTPYTSNSTGFVSPQEQIFDLQADPSEQNNIFTTAPVVKEQAQETLCNWILGSVWTTQDNDPQNPLVVRCTTLLEN